jgi:hypothetical protein
MDQAGHTAHAAHATAQATQQQPDLLGRGVQSHLIDPSTGWISAEAHSMFTSDEDPESEHPYQFMLTITRPRTTVEKKKRDSLVEGSGKKAWRGGASSVRRETLANGYGSGSELEDGYHSSDGEITTGTQSGRPRRTRAPPLRGGKSDRKKVTKEKERTKDAGGDPHTAVWHLHMHGMSELEADRWILALMEYGATPAEAVSEGEARRLADCKGTGVVLTGDWRASKAFIAGFQSTPTQSPAQAAAAARPGYARHGEGTPQFGTPATPTAAMRAAAAYSDSKAAGTLTAPCTICSLRPALYARCAMHYTLTAPCTILSLRMHYTLTMHPLYAHYVLTIRSSCTQ